MIGFQSGFIQNRICESSGKRNKESFMRKFVFAAAAAGVLALGALAPTASQAAAIGITAPSIESNVIQARCWRNRHGRLRCNNRRVHRHHRTRHCWHRHGVRHCVWR
jgi:hypothetical protein